MAHQPTIGRDSGRSSTTELLPTEPKTRIHADFTLDHYNISSSMANFYLGERAQGYLITSGDPTLSGTFTLTDADGKTVVFTIDTNVSDITIISDPDNIRVGVSDVLGDNDDIGRRLEDAINLYVGITAVEKVAVSPNYTSTLTQRTPGVQGNTEIEVHSSLFGEIGGIDFGSVTQGTGGAQPPFSKRFQLVRAPEDTGEALRRNDQKTEA